MPKKEGADAEAKLTRGASEAGQGRPDPPLTDFRGSAWLADFRLTEMDSCCPEPLSLGFFVMAALVLTRTFPVSPGLTSRLRPLPGRSACGLLPQIPSMPSASPHCF